MTDHNRGAYTPQSEAPLSFDARRTRGERPFPLALMISAGILVMIIVALLVFLMRQPDGSEAPAEGGGEVIDAMKIEPAQPLPTNETPGLQVAVEDPLAAPTFAPPPEQPAPRATAPVATVPAAPTPAPKAAASPADPIGTLIPKPTPSPKAPAAAPSPAPKATPAPATASGGAAQVQIGAFSSAALAEKGWNDVAAMLPGQMAGKTKRVEQVDANGSTLHRAFVGGFASREQARAFCDQLKAQGRSCLVR